MNKHRVITLIGVLCLLWPAVTDAASVTLRWTAPGDDGWSGRAAAYDIRYAGSPISEATWSQTARVPITPIPATAGTPQSAVVLNLIPGERYYFAVRTVDEAGNWSPISNIASAIVAADGCVGVAGNVDCDPLELVNLTDVSVLIDHLFVSRNPLGCAGEANINGDASISISDLTHLVNYLFYEGSLPVPCL